MANLLTRRSTEESIATPPPYMEGVSVRIIPDEDEPRVADWTVSTNGNPVDVQELLGHLNEISEHSKRPLPGGKELVNSKQKQLIENSGNREIPAILKGRIAKYAAAVLITSNVLLVGMHTGKQAVAESVGAIPLVGSLFETAEDPYSLQDNGIKAFLRGPMDIVGLDGVWRDNNQNPSDKNNKEDGSVS